MTHCNGLQIADDHYQLVLADAIEAHDFAVTFGARNGVSSLHLIESAIARPYFGYHLTMPEKCAALLESCVQNHGFVDGNKRTAWLLVEIMIERSGYMLTIPDDAPIDDLVVDVATGDLKYEQLLNWFTVNLAEAT